MQFDMAEISPAWKKKRRGCQFFFLFLFSLFFFFVYVLYMCYIPCRIGFPVEAIELTPMQTKSPKPVFAV